MRYRTIGVPKSSQEILTALLRDSALLTTALLRDPYCTGIFAITRVESVYHDVEAYGMHVQELVAADGRKRIVDTKYLLLPNLRPAMLWPH